MHSMMRNTSKNLFARYLSSVRRRFYENVFIKEEHGKYFIQLDGKSVKTPFKQDLYAPTRKLANILATEWQSQKDTICPHKMHMTALCNTCIDNPRKKSQQDMIGEIVAFLHSDTICARVPVEESETVARKQMEKWDPLLEWFNNRFGVQMRSTTNIFGLEQSKNTIEAISSNLLKFSNWKLAGFLFAVESIKSFVIPMAILENKLSINNGLQLSRLEIELQAEKWGQVEWHHDIEYENQKASLSAGILFCHLCNISQYS